MAQNDNTQALPLLLAVQEIAPGTYKISALVEAEQRIANLEAELEALRELRPVWAQGYSSESIATQAPADALAQIWAALDVENQTQAAIRLGALVAALGATTRCLAWHAEEQDRAVAMDAETLRQARAVLAALKKENP